VEMQDRPQPNYVRRKFSFQEKLANIAKFYKMGFMC